MVDKMGSLITIWNSLLKDSGREKADEFYVKKITPLLLAKEDKFKKYDGIIIPVGRAIDKLALLVKSVFAKEYHFLVSTNESLDTVDRVVKLTKIKPSANRVHRIVLNDPFSVHKIVRSIWEEERKAKLAVYISSGATSISTSLAMLARYFDFDVLYQEWGSYDMDLKRADPLKRKVKILEDPLQVYGDLELEKAIVLFNNRKFNDVLKILNDVKRRTIRMEFVFFLDSLTKGYMSWQRFEFKAAEIFLNQARELVKRVDKIYEKPIANNLKTLKILSLPIPFIQKLKNPQYVLAFVYELFVRSQNSVKDDDFMLAITYLYRCIDIISQSELVMLKIDPWNVNWSLLKKDVVEKYDNSWKKLTSFSGIKDSKLGLLQATVLLSAIKESDLDLKEIWEVSKFRNQLIIEHGDSVGNIKQYKRIEKVVTNITNNFKRKYKVTDIDPEFSIFIKLAS